MSWFKKKAPAEAPVVSEDVADLQVEQSGDVARTDPVDSTPVHAEQAELPEASDTSGQADASQLSAEDGDTAPAPTKNSLWRRLKRKSPIDVAAQAGTPPDPAEDSAPELSTEPAAPKASFLSRVTEKRKFHSIPIRVLIGYLPEVRERDARDYALGVAEKHFDQPALAFYDAFKFGEGYAYEVHEGGDGGAYLPEIIKYFDSQGPYRTGENTHVVIRTGTRLVEVQRQRVGLAAILLPEAATTEATEWLEPRERLSPALNQRTGLLAVGAAFFITGFFALIVGSMLTRYQPYEEPPKPGVATIAYEDLPVSQWSRLQNLAPNSYVTKLVYENKKWQRPEIKNAEPVPVAPAAAPVPVSPAMPVPAGQADMPPSNP